MPFFYQTLIEIAENQTILPIDIKIPLLNLVSNITEEKKKNHFNEIKQILDLEFKDFEYNSIQLEILSPLNEIASHSLIIDKKFILPHKKIKHYKDEILQVLEILNSFNCPLPFVPNMILKYNENPTTKRYLRPSNNHIGINNTDINPSTFMHELTHFIDYLCSSKRWLYSDEIKKGQINQSLPQYNAFIKDFDILIATQYQRINNLTDYFKYYFNENQTDKELVKNLPNLLAKNIKNNITKQDITTYLLTPDNQPTKSLFTIMSEYIDFVNKSKNANSKEYYNKIYEKLARVSQSIFEEKNNKLVQDGFKKHKIIIPLGSEREHYFNQWLNILSNEVGLFIKNNNNNILNTHNQNTKLFDLKNKIYSNRNEEVVINNNIGKIKLK